MFYNVVFLYYSLVLGRTSEACSSIALELTSHEMGIENLVLAPFNNALDVSMNQPLCGSIQNEMGIENLVLAPFNNALDVSNHMACVGLYKMLLTSKASG